MSQPYSTVLICTWPLFLTLKIVWSLIRPVWNSLNPISTYTGPIFQSLPYSTNGLDNTWPVLTIFDQITSTFFLILNVRINFFVNILTTATKIKDNNNNALTWHITDRMTRLRNWEMGGFVELFPRLGPNPYIKTLHYSCLYTAI